MENMRLLSLLDKPLYQDMQTGMTHDYMLDVFEEITSTEHNRLYGLFLNNHLVAVSGYTYFPGGNVMIGRLRCDVRFRKKGYPTKLLQALVTTLAQDQKVNFIGGYTNISNIPAQKLMTRLGFNYIDTYHSFPCLDLRPFIRKNEPIWHEVTKISQKRDALESLKLAQVPSFTLEAYYPFPYTKELIDDEKLAHMLIFQSPKTKRYLYIDKDYKGEALLLIRYFHNDLFTAEGLFETIHAVKKESVRLPWFNLSKEQFKTMTHPEVFRIEEGWQLHGMKKPFNTEYLK